jgi:hypothetical protein
VDSLLKTDISVTVGFHSNLVLKVLDNTSSRNEVCRHIILDFFYPLSKNYKLFSVLSSETEENFEEGSYCGQQGKSKRKILSKPLRLLVGQRCYPLSQRLPKNSIVKLIVSKRIYFI